MTSSSRSSAAAGYAVSHGLGRERAAAHLREVTARPDLLARAAGIIAGASERSTGDWSVRMAQVHHLIAAGADREQLPRWIAQGMDNARRRWATGPVKRPDQAEAAERLSEVLAGLDDWD